MNTRSALNTLATLTLATAAWAAVHTVNLSWSADPNASGYDVYRAQKSGGPYERRAVTKEPEYQDKVEAGQTYYYVTTSVSRTGQESAKSREITVKVPTP
jgi:fibronectin type 3 domain-containing protein